MATPDMLLNTVLRLAIIPTLLSIFGVLYSLKACFECISSWLYQRENDARLRKEAQNGTIILLSYEQYLSLHDASPNMYPLTEEAVLAIRIEEKDTNIRMTSKDLDLLDKYIYDAKQEKETDAKRTSCMEDLTKMRNILSSHIAELEEKNQEAAAAVVVNSINAIKAEQRSGANGAMVNPDPGSFGLH